MMHNVFTVLAEQPGLAADYTPTMLTVAGTLLAAGFTSVIAQYFFAPTLEARKQTLLERSRVASDAVNSIRAMYFQLDTTAMKRFRLKDMFGFQQHESTFMELADKFDAAVALNNAGLKPKYIELALKAQFAAELLAMVINDPERPGADKFDPVLKLLRHTMHALDPVNPPWSRAFHCWRGGRIYNRLPYPGEEERAYV